ncbi:hypothetical protein HTV45_12535 [Streptomyces sp. CHD11]|uniref:hypothetical protein n=1 Tax=Streptomyces sp. CHD11 TaxID=2741325 RepID=UPI001BFC6788|nr:hypothetical protein [Streptomyces sp. CHD11]MBT3151703.1 hypothetical protein [Streptomyces sp. CHD11]
MRGWKGSVRRLTASAGALAAALAVMLGGASPAVAGGPTSVLVVSPESQETAALYYSDAEYGQLEKLLGPVGRGTPAKPPEAVSSSARLINVTWMVHDVTPWRVDRVFVGLPDEDVWIHTASHVPESSNGFWHRAEYPSDVYKFLFGLGVMGRTTAPVPASGMYPAPWETAQARPATDDGTAAAAAQTRAVAAGSTDWWWAIPGVVAGASLALLLRPYGTRLVQRRKDAPGPRQELLDV